jgi:hypothetical protein
MSDVRGFVADVQERYGLRPVVPFEQPVSTTRFRFNVAPEGVRPTKDGTELQIDAPASTFDETFTEVR